MNNGDDTQSLDPRLSSRVSAPQTLSQLPTNGFSSIIAPIGIGTFNQLSDPTASPTKEIPVQESENLIAELTYELLVDSTNSELSEDISDDDPISDNSVSVRLPALPRSSLPTGLCYDARMRFHCELEPSKERSDFHPEDPRRIYYIYRALCDAGLVDDKISTPPLVKRVLHRIPARHATKSEICLVHQKSHYEFMERTRGY